MKQQKGFTLVEIAIVLVIIGLLLGGVLKGQQMIESGRVKSAANDMKGIAAAYNSYLDQYRALPGDDARATAALRGTSWAGVTVGDGSGAITATAAGAFTAAGEVVAFFSELRGAGLLTGNQAATGTASLPVNPWGGFTSIVNAAAVQGRGAGVRLMVCMGSVPGSAARALDNTLDDGMPGTGAMRATVGAANTAPGGGAIAAATGYLDNNTYTICNNI